MCLVVCVRVHVRVRVCVRVRVFVYTVHDVNAMILFLLLYAMWI